MIADPKAAALADNFAGQWLETRSLDAVTPATRAKFPDWNPELRDAMRTETRLFFDAVLRENRPISDFIDGKYTFLNERLAKHYGIDGVEGPDFRRVELPRISAAASFTHGSVLTVSSYPTRTSVVLRGKIPARERAQLAAASAAGRRARARRGVGRRAHEVRSANRSEQHRADRSAPAATQDGSARLRARELRRDRPVADADGPFPLDVSGTFRRHGLRPNELKAIASAAHAGLRAGLVPRKC